jgi:hypothetical protein
MQAIRAALVAELSKSHPQTVRQVFYQMTVKGVVPKVDSAKGYGTVQRLLVEMRMAETAKRERERKIASATELGMTRKDAEEALDMAKIPRARLDRLIEAARRAKEEPRSHVRIELARIRAKAEAVAKRPTIPFSWIADNTRWMRKPRTYTGPEQALRHTAETYRRDLWANSDVYVEIWCEKDALAGVIMEETVPYDVPLMVARGFSSITYLYNAAQNIAERGKPAYIYHFGDRDPSGKVSERDIEAKLRHFAPDAEIHFVHVAVTREQVDRWDLPKRPTKRKGNPHAKGYKGDSVELDALPAATLRALVRACIEQHIDKRKLKALEVAEESEREMLERWADALKNGNNKPRRHTDERR